MPGKIVVYKAIQDDNTSYWPEAFPIDVLEAWKNELGPISFASQYQSSPIDLMGNELKLEWLHFYDHTNEMPLSFEKIVAFIDPAISKTKSSDFFAMAVAGRANNRIYLLDLLRTKAPIEAQLDYIHDKYAIWHVDEFVIEAGGQQLYFVEYIQKETMYHITTPPASWHRSDKKNKFEVAANHFNASRALLPGNKDDIGRWVPIQEFLPFVEEWTQFPAGLHDDTIDAVAGVISSLIDNTIPYGIMEPGTAEEAIEFANRSLVKSNRILTDEEKKILENYYGDTSQSNIRKVGLFRHESKPDLRMNRRDG